MVSILLFDLGETLIHIDPASKALIEECRFQAVQRYFFEIKHNFTPSLLRFKYREAVEAISDSSNKEVSIKKVFVGMLERLSVDNSLVNFEKLEKIFYRAEVEAWTVFPGAIPCLEWAQKAGFKLGLVSNARSDWAVREVLNRLRLNKHFKVAVTSAQVGWRKPRPEPFLEALKYFGEKPQHAAFIGDTFSTDIVGAKRLGMKTIYLNRNDDPIPSIEDIVPDFTIKDFLEVVKVAKNLMDH